MSLLAPNKTVICMFCPGRRETAGGIGRLIGNLADELGQRHPELDVREIDTRGSGSILISPLHLAAALARFFTIRFSSPGCVAHLNMSSHGSAARKFVVFLFSKALRVPVVLHLHAAVFERFLAGLPRPFQGLLRWMFRGSDRVIVLGNDARRLVCETLGAPRRRVDIIRNGVRLPERQGVSPDGVPHIVFLGRLGDRKGVRELIAALAAPKVMHRAWRATIAGDGDVDAYQKQAHDLGIAERISFPGWLNGSEASALLGRATILALPSRAEGLPMSVLEGLAHGLAVITTPVGALPDCLVHDESVLFVRPGNADDLAAALHALLADEALRARIAAGGSASFRKNYAMPALADRFAFIYGELVREARRPVGQKPVSRDRAASS